MGENGIFKKRKKKVERQGFNITKENMTTEFKKFVRQTLMNFRLKIKEKQDAFRPGQQKE